jgi:hypothetical protein
MWVHITARLARVHVVVLNGSTGCIQRRTGRLANRSVSKQQWILCLTSYMVHCSCSCILFPKDTGKIQWRGTCCHFFPEATPYQILNIHVRERPHRERGLGHCGRQAHQNVLCEMESLASQKTVKAQTKTPQSNMLACWEVLVEPSMKDFDQ